MADTVVAAQNCHDDHGGYHRSLPLAFTGRDSAADEIETAFPSELWRRGRTAQTNCFDAFFAVKQGGARENLVLAAADRFDIRIKRLNQLARKSGQTPAIVGKMASAIGPAILVRPMSGRNARQNKTVFLQVVKRDQ